MRCIVLLGRIDGGNSTHTKSSQLKSILLRGGRWVGIMEGRGVWWLGVKI